MLLHMLRVFMLCNTRDYARATICAWLVNAYQSISLHQLAILRRSHLTLWNEEPGEISLSMLAQTTAFHTNRTHIEHVCTTYQLLQVQRELLASLPGLDKRTFNKGQPILSTSQDVVHTGVFFSTLIREMASKTLTMYSDPASSWRDKKAADATRAAVLITPWSKLAKLSSLQEHIGDIRRLVVGGTWEPVPTAAEVDAQETDSDGDIDFDGLDHKYGAMPGLIIVSL